MSDDEPIIRHVSLRYGYLTKHWQVGDVAVWDDDTESTVTSVDQDGYAHFGDPRPTDRSTWVRHRTGLWQA